MYFTLSVTGETAANLLRLQHFLYFYERYDVFCSYIDLVGSVGCLFFK